MNPQTTDLRYPIGKFTIEGEVTREHVAAWIDDIAALAEDLRSAVSPLTDGQLDTRYRPGGWTVTARGESPASTETVPAPAGQGALREHIRPYVTEEQRSPPGCRDGRMP